LKPLVAASSVSKAFGSHHVLNQANFVVYDNEKCAVVGPNGSGKSTIFKLIAGGLVPELGGIAIREGARVGYMPQIPDIPPAMVARDVLAAPTVEMQRLEAECAAIEARMGEPGYWDQPESQAEMARYGELQAALAQERAKGQAIDNPLLGDLGVPEEALDKPFGALSGGEKTKILLARALARYEQADLLMLDEPTNHLDIDTVEWIEDLLRSCKAAVLLSAHDKYLLDNTCTKVLEVTEKKVYEWEGNYSAYREQRAALQKAFDAKRKRDRLELERQLAIIQEIKRRNRFDAQAQSKATRLEQQKRQMSEQDREFGLAPDQQAGKKGMRLRFEAAHKSSNEVLSMEGVAKSYGDRLLFKDVELELLKGDKMALVGANGAGKTSLLKLLTGEEKPDAGAIRVAPGVRLGYYDQQHEGLDPQRTLLEEVKEARPHIEEADARALLGRFLFRGDDAFKKVGVLSGGERARMALLKFIIRPHNLLVLDEPTNHLDIESQEVVAQALQEYDGTVLVVSHNRSFLDGIVNKVAMIANHHVAMFAGDFSSTRTLTRLAEFEGQGQGTRYKVRSTFKDWETGKKYITGEVIEVTGAETQGFRRLLRWAIETGRVEEK
jgi:ATP-binding cassette subfamily F protein 3